MAKIKLIMDNDYQPLYLLLQTSIPVKSHIRRPCTPKHHVYILPHIFQSHPHICRPHPHQKTQPFYYRFDLRGQI